MLSSACSTPRRATTFVISIAATTVAANCAVAATFATFDPSNGNGTSPYAINSSGVVSGSYEANINNVEVSAFLRAPDGTITDYTVPNAVLTFGFSINDAGTVAGSYRFSDNKDHGYIRTSDGTITTFDVRGTNETTPVAINSHGEVTGYANGDTRGIGFVRDPDGTITTFKIPRDSGGAYPRSIDAEGAVTGICCGVLRHACRKDS